MNCRLRCNASLVQLAVNISIEVFFAVLPVRFESLKSRLMSPIQDRNWRFRNANDTNCANSAGTSQPLNPPQPRDQKFLQEKLLKHPSK